MLQVCAPGCDIKETTHHFCIRYGGRTYPSFPKGEHGRGRRAEIEEDRDGADLTVSVDGRRERIEVKGTESSTLDWHKLKVSSQRSHDALTRGGASIYRVVDVSGPNPRIYVLTHGRHFNLEHEPRWAVKRVPPQDGRYPLRGEPYRYDLPHEPVAADDWAIQP